MEVDLNVGPDREALAELGQEYVWLNTRTVSAITGYAEKTLRNYRSRQIGPPSRTLMGSVRYNRKELADWIDTNLGP